MVGLEPTILPSTLLLQGEEVTLEPEHFGNKDRAYFSFIPLWSLSLSLIYVFVTKEPTKT